MSQLPDDQLLCGRFRRLPPGLGQSAPPALRPFDALLPVRDEISGKEAWLLPFSSAFVGSEIDRSYFMMGATSAVQLSANQIIAPAFVDRDEQWFWIGYWADDLKDHPADPERQGEAAIVYWALGVAKGLDELHQLGKQHGLLQPGAVVRGSDGEVRIWGGAVYELLNKVRLAVKAKQDRMTRDTLFVPAVLEGGPLSLQDELAGWAMTVAARWFNASGEKALTRLQESSPSDGWACDLKRLITQCLERPLEQGISSARDLVTRLEVIVDAVKGPGLLNERRMQEFVPIDGSMPSLESIEVSAHDPRYSTLVPARPVTSANGRPAFAENPNARARRSTSRDLSEIPVGTLGTLGAAARPPSKKNGFPWLWVSVGLGVVLLAGLSIAWQQGKLAQVLALVSSQDAQEDAGQGSGQGESGQQGAGAGDACPTHAARLPGGSCMDRFEYPGEGKLPQVSVTKNQASLLCEARGGRLCKAKEWLSACRLGSPNLEGCRLRASRKDRARPRLSGKSDCVSGGEFYDLLGNAAEWVADGSARGGDAKTRRNRASCKLRVPAKKARSAGFSIGFRCCYGADGPTPDPES